MKVLLLNGSPRGGNTKFAIDTIADTISKNIPDAEIENIVIEGKDIHCCIGCDSCIKNNGICIFDDDMFDILESVRLADVIIFGSPVYWWGITAQLKMVIDRMYALSGNPGHIEKKIGLVHIGQDSIDGPQYALISKQFQCISEHLKWEIAFDKPISAASLHDLENNEKEASELAELWKTL